MWVAIVYDGNDKIASRVFHSEAEEEARPEAKKWVVERFGEGTDWSLHQVHSGDK